MRGYFLTYPVHNTPNQAGIKIKIQMQINAFSRAGFTCTEYQLGRGIEPFPERFVRSIQWLPFSNVWPHWRTIREVTDVDFIYMRRPSAMSLAMRRFLAALKKTNPQLEIIMEIPTYPYDDEYRKVRKLLLIRDKFNRTRLRGLVDHFAIVGYRDNINELWGVPVVQFDNGCDVPNVSVKRSRLADPTELTLLCVAMFSSWHGYERLIEGLAKYYRKGGSANVKLVFVGEGREAESYKRLARKTDLISHVEFRGALFGQELDDAYNSCDIAVGALGLYKKNLSSISALKISDALSRGMPVIIAGDMEIFRRIPFEYYLKISNDAEPADINRILDFWAAICKEDPNKVVSNIRNYAEQNLDVMVQMKPVFQILRANDAL